MDAHPAPKKNNTLNTIGIITVGVVGSVFVYVSIIGLQALYVSETSPVATVKSFGAQGEVKDSLKAEQIGNISEPRTKTVFGPANTQLYSVGIDAGKTLIIRDASDPSRFVPAIGPSIKPTIAPAFGRPQPLPVAPPPAPTGDQPPATEPGAPGEPGAVTPPATEPGAVTPPATPGNTGAATPTTPATTPAAGTPPPATGPAASGAPRPSDAGGAAPATPTPAGGAH